MKWIDRYSGYWQLICTPGIGRMNMVAARNIIHCLARNGLYEYIFVFLTVGPMSILWTKKVESLCCFF